jgi:predicted transcriptional regulator
LSAESQVKEEASAKAGSSPPENPAISEEKPPESPPQQPDLSAEAPTYVGAKEDINASPPDNQASQVQSEPSDNASTIQAENAPSQSAEIKPEPPESPTIPSNPPPSNSQLGKTISFGDLLSGDSPPSPSSDLSNLSTPSDLPISSSPNPQPTTNNQQPSISFGDLIKDIEITPPPSIPEGMHQPVRPEAERPIEQSQPTPPPPPPPQTQPQASPAPPPFISPISPLSATQDQAKERLTILQQKGNQRKKDKRQAILQKIIDLTKTKGKINNQEAQKIFHLPQSTLSDYFKELVLKGILKKEGKGKATYYHL